MQCRVANAHLVLHSCAIIGCEFEILACQSPTNQVQTPKSRIPNPQIPGAPSAPI